MKYLTIGGAAKVTSKNSHNFKGMADLPVPGGPHNKIPLGELKTSVVNYFIYYPSLSNNFSIAKNSSFVLSIANFNYGIEKL